MHGLPGPRHAVGDAVYMCFSCSWRPGHWAGSPQHVLWAVHCPVSGLGHPGTLLQMEPSRSGECVTRCGQIYMCGSAAGPSSGSSCGLAVGLLTDVQQAHTQAACYL